MDIYSHIRDNASTKLQVDLHTDSHYFRITMIRRCDTLKINLFVLVKASVRDIGRVTPLTDP